ncbi:MAG: SUMF1/EgtB/PvdO family nonheme iron enzyme [Myxococcales bacterium]|nr:SUMF1/EgtB/PvdO family nonheme iron enzyme [Myxococcales bacterium]
MAAAGAVCATPESLRGTLAIGESVFSASELRLHPTAARYLPVRELGQGGMGRVEVVFDRVMGRPIARKRLLDPSNAALLHMEALVGAQLEHPCIVPIYDVACDADGAPSYTMRVVNGRTLRDVLDEEPEPGAPRLSRLLAILRQVCLAVDYAHSRGVVHRDLKPENVVVGEFGEVYVLDWGVATLTDASAVRLPLESVPELAIAGSPGYMAPEQATGGPVDARADVYALGVILHEVLTGQPLFERECDLSGVLERIVAGSVPPPSEAAPTSVPGAFDDLVRACLKVEVERRPASARVIADAIDAYLDSERARLEAEAEAAARVAEGERALDEADRLERDATLQQERAERCLAQLRDWDALEDKERAWALAEAASRARTEARLALGAAQAAFTAALAKAPEHPGARRGLAALHYRELLGAEAQGDRDRVAQHLLLARRYDDGALELELRDEGTLTVRTSAPVASLALAAYDSSGLLLRLGPRRVLAVGRPALLRAGSYVVFATQGGRELRYPLVVERARRHELSLCVPSARELPEDMVLVPGGPFLGLRAEGTRLEHLELPDFAIGRLPVTLRAYVAFLDDLPEPERLRRTPGQPGWTPHVEKRDGVWRLSDSCVEGEAARRRVPPGRELDLPVLEISWFDACAYAAWHAAATGLPYRLPTDLEWEKAMRGADGRPFPMGHHIDPVLAKLRSSRPEPSQPEPVGAFPLDESPYGVRDLAGGMSDWTSTPSDGRPLPRLDEEGQPSAAGRQALYRGGNWSAVRPLTPMRYPLAIDRRYAGTGFRLALDLPGAGSSALCVEPMRR